jgi:hypothetical protein
MRTPLSAALSAATALALLLGLSAPASATVAPVAPVRVVVSGPVVHVRMQLHSDTPTTARGGHGVEITTTTRTGMIVTGEAWSDYATVPVALDMPATLAPVGEWRLEAEDYGDGRVTPIMVRVLRVTRLSVAPVTVTKGRASGRVAVTHYEPMTGRYAPAPLSPVLVQRQARPGMWSTVTTWATDARGVAAGSVALPSGQHVLRYVRPDGARDALAASGPVRVTVP